MIPAHIEDLLDHGYSVIPTNGKVACVEWKPWQIAKPGYDRTEQWAKQFPSCSWAMLCGQFHGLVIVDGDSADAVSLIESMCIPTPMRVVTRRGKHFYYKHPGFHVTSKRYLDEPEVDVKGDGAVCTALGSIRQDGFSYVLDDGADLVSVHDLPLYDKAWFPQPEIAIPEPVDLDRYKHLDRFERARRWIEKAETVSSGSRNQKALSVAYGAVRGFGLSLEEGMMLMRSWNMGNNPPLDDAELKTVTMSALRSGRQSLGGKCRMW